MQGEPLSVDKKLPPPRPPLDKCRVISDDERAVLVAKGILPESAKPVVPLPAPGQGKSKGAIPPAPRRVRPKHRSAQRQRRMRRTGQLNLLRQAS